MGISAFKLASGSVVYVEADSGEDSGEQRAAIQRLFPSEPEQQEPPPFKQKLMPILEALETIREGVVSLTPSEVTLEAGVKFVGSAGVLLAKYGAEASVSVKLKWKQAGKPDDTEEN